MPSVICTEFYMQALNAECHYAECRYAECHYAECHYAECHYAECHYAECRYAERHGTFFSGNPYWNGRACTVDLLVLTSSEQLLLVLKNILYFAKLVALKRR